MTCYGLSDRNFCMSFDTYGENFEYRLYEYIGSQNRHRQVIEVRGRWVSRCSAKTAKVTEFLYKGNYECYGEIDMDFDRLFDNRSNKKLSNIAGEKSKVEDFKLWLLYVENASLAINRAVKSVLEILVKALRPFPIGLLEFSSIETSIGHSFGL